jgi:receptor protein-tyrosine kinase
VRDRLVASGIPRTEKQLNASILAGRRPNTTLINVQAADSEPSVALQIARGIIPAFNASLQELQATVDTPSSNSHLDSLVPWEVPSQASDTPISPDISRNILLAIGAAIVLAVGLAFLIERIDNTVKSDSDIRLRLGLPLLGAVFLRDAVKDDFGKPAALEVISATRFKDPMSEQFRALRTNIMFSQVDKPTSSIVVTSTVSGEGKTTAACNLAVVMAQAGSRVILVDADFRRSALHRVFDQPDNVGLGNLILGDRPQAEALRDTQVPNLRVIFAGTTPHNPSEVLGSTRMAHILQELSQEADVIIFDSPPVGAVTDATVLSTLAGVAVLVVEQGRAGMPAIARAAETLTTVGVSLIGVVLNKARTQDRAHYQYYYETDAAPPSDPGPTPVRPERVAGGGPLMPPLASSS